METKFIGIDENGVTYPVKKWKIVTRMGKDYQVGFCELDDTIGWSWCRFETII